MPTFEEEQRFAPWVSVLVYSLIAVAAAMLLYARHVEGTGVFVGPVSMVAVLAIAFFTLSMKMITRVEADGVRIKSMAFINRLIPFQEIETAQAVKYRPLIDYGGWGVRIGPRGKAYNMRGHHGVQLVLKNGGRVLIGSQRSRELVGAIHLGMDKV